MIANSYGVDCVSNCNSVHVDIRRVRCASGFYSRPDKSCLQKVSLSFLSDMFPSIFWVMLNRMAPYHKW